MDARRRSSEGGAPSLSALAGIELAEAGRPFPAENSSGQRSRSQSDLDSQDPDVRTALLQDELEQCKRELSGIVEEVNVSFQDWEQRQQDKRFTSPPPSKIRRSPQSFDPAHRPPNPAKYKKGRSFDNIFEFTAGVGTEDEKRQRAILRRSGSSTSMSEHSSNLFDIQGQTSSRRSSGGFSIKSPSAASWKGGSPGDLPAESPRSFKGRTNNAKGKDRPKWKSKQTIKENQECRAYERIFGIDDTIEGVGGDDITSQSQSRSPPFALVVSQLQIQKRMQDLKRLEDRAVEIRRGLKGAHAHSTSASTSSEDKAGRHHPRSEWKIKFSTDEFWIELRSRVRGNRQTEADERRLVMEARAAIERNEPILKIKRYQFGSDNVKAAVEEVGRLLADVDTVFENAYPCAHASGVGKHKLPNNMRLDKPNSLAMHCPEFSCGSVEDRSTFVSNLEALRVWHAAAQVGLAAQAGLERTAREVQWDTPDLDGLLHRVPMQEVTSLILARAKPALEKLHALYHDDQRDVRVTIIDHVKPDGTFDKVAKKTVSLPQRSYQRQLGAKGMKLPHLASSQGLAGSLAMLPLQILLKIVSSRVAQRPNQPRMMQQWCAAGVFQQRFEECVQLLQAGRLYQEELREYIPDVLVWDGHEEPATTGVQRRWREEAQELQLQLREVLYMAFRFCSAMKLEVGGLDARELREACIDLRREEAPRLVDALGMFKDAEVAERAAACHCQVLERLLREGRLLVESSASLQAPRAQANGAHSSGSSTLDWAVEVDHAVSACWAAVRVARAGIGALGLCAEMEVLDDMKDVLEGLYHGGYVWVRPERKVEVRGMQATAKKGAKDKDRGGAALQHWDEEGRTVLFASPLLFLSSGGPDEEEVLGKERCVALLRGTYGVEQKLFEEFGGHIVRVKIPNSSYADVERIWAPNCSVSTVRVPSLDAVLEPLPEAGTAVLTGPNSYTLESEIKAFSAKVTEEMQTVESSISKLVECWAREWGLVDEAQPNAPWTRFPLAAQGPRAAADLGAASPTIGMLEFGTLQRVFDLATYTASALSSGLHTVHEGVGRCKWDVARSWAVARLAVVRQDKGEAPAARAGEGREEGDALHHLRSADLKVTQERIKYLEEALRGAVGALRDSEWAWWLEFFEGVHQEKRDWESDERRTQAMLAKVVRSSGGGMDVREQVIEELEGRLKKEMEDRVGAGRVREERKHMNRMVLRDEQGQRVHWIKLGRLGGGTYGEVYRAQFWQSMDFVAVKEIRDTGKREVASKVEREMKVMAMLKHSNVVRFYGRESAQGSTRRMYMFIEYCAEGHLRDLVRSWMANGRRATEGSVVPLKIVRNYTMQMARGLQHMHNRSITHRDIKALNILVADNGNSVKISDFGEAIEKPDGQSWGEVAPRNASGTIGHQAPELLRCYKHPDGFGPKIDIWSLACVVTEMLTGQGPEHMLWQGPAGKDVVRENLTVVACTFLVHRIASDNPEYLVLPFREFLQALPEDVTVFLESCFVVDPKLRPNADDILQDPFLHRR